MAENTAAYLYHQEHDEPRLILCENCENLFSALENKEYVKDKETYTSWDAFGDVEDSYKYEIYKIIYRCPYCKWKHKKNIPSIYKQSKIL